MAQADDQGMLCPICRHERREQIENGIKEGRLTKKTVAEELQMTPDAVYEHMANHYGRYAPALDSPADKARQRSKDGVDDKTLELYSKHDVLMNNFMSLSDRFNNLAETDTYDKETVQMLVSLNSELRRTAMDMAQLRGDMKKQVEVTIKSYHELRVLVFSMLCQSCQEKVEKALEQNTKTIEAEHGDNVQVPMNVQR